MPIFIPQRHFMLGQNFSLSPWRAGDICTLSAGVTGHVKLDDNRDRLGEYVVWHRPSTGAEYQPFVDIKMKSSEVDDIVTQTHTLLQTRTWPE